MAAWDPDPSRFAELKDNPAAKWADTPGGVRAACDVVLIHLVGNANIEAACFGKGGLATTKGAHIVIDLSTTGMDLTMRASQSLDVAWLDSPIAGDPAAAEKGELTLMVGGTEELYDWVRPVLADVGSNVTLMGPLGAGQTAMLINQALVGMSYVMLAEVLTQVRAAGIDPDKLVNSLKGGMGNSAMLQAVFSHMASGQFTPARVPASQTNEELQSVRLFNEAFGLSLPMQEIAIDQFRHYAETTGGDTDSAGIATVYVGETE